MAVLVLLFVLGTGGDARAGKAKKVDWSQYLETPGSRTKPAASRSEAPKKASKKARTESRPKAKPAKSRRRS